MSRHFRHADLCDYQQISCYAVTIGQHIYRARFSMFHTGRKSMVASKHERSVTKSWASMLSSRLGTRLLAGGILPAPVSLTIDYNRVHPFQNYSAELREQVWQEGHRHGPTPIDWFALSGCEISIFAPSDAPFVTLLFSSQVLDLH